jgi:hypothetical protein
MMGSRIERAGWAFVLLSAGILGCSSSNDSATGCGALSACCATLAGTEAEECQTSVMMSGATDAQCNEALQGFQMTGLCGGTGGSGGSGGGGGAAGSGEGGVLIPTGCAALKACCPNLPVEADPMGCLTVVMEGTPEACAESLATYEAMDYCLPLDGGADGGGADSSVISCKNPTPEQEAATERCEACMNAECGSATMAFRAGCAPLLDCADACDCGDTSCIEGCENESTSSCTTAVEPYFMCEQTSCQADCTSVDGGAS